MIDMTNKVRLSVRLDDGTTVKGSLNIGKYNRLSDFLNSKEADSFLIVYEASMPGADGKVVIVNRDHIAWAVPE